MKTKPKLFLKCRSMLMKVHNNNKCMWRKKILAFEILTALAFLGADFIKSC